MRRRGFWSDKQWAAFLVMIMWICNTITGVYGSIHEYRREAFSPRSNAHFFHGGSEGLYASKRHYSNDSPENAFKGKSFIRLFSSLFISVGVFFFLLGRGGGGGGLGKSGVGNAWLFSFSRKYSFARVDVNFYAN